MKKLSSLVVMVALVLAGSFGMATIGAEEVYADTYADRCEHTILGLKPWYAGLDKKDAKTCAIESPESEKDMPKFVWTIILNVLSDLFLLVGYLAIGFVIYGGFLYIMSAGEPGKVAKGKTVLTSATIGLIIAILATVLVNIITGVLLEATK